MEGENRVGVAAAAPPSNHVINKYMTTSLSALHHIEFFFALTLHYMDDVMYA